MWQISVVEVTYVPVLIFIKWCNKKSILPYVNVKCDVKKQKMLRSISLLSKFKYLIIDGVDFGGEWDGWGLYPVMLRSHFLQCSGNQVESGFYWGLLHARKLLNQCSISPGPDYIILMFHKKLQTPWICFVFSAFWDHALIFTSMASYISNRETSE